MKKLSIALPAAAALLGGVSAASAADFLPVIAEPVDYVERCAADGTELDGVAFTQTTCIKITGRVRFGVHFGTWLTDGTSSPIAPGLPQSLPSNWKFTTDAQLGVLASRLVGDTWLQAFIQFTATSDNTSGDRGVTLNEFWLRYGWLKAGYFDSVYGGPGFTGAQTVDQISASWGGWTLAFEDPRDRAVVTAPVADTATMYFPDVVLAYAGGMGGFDYKLAGGLGSRTDGVSTYTVYGLLGSLSFGNTQAVKVELGGAVGWNGFDFVAPAESIASQNVGAGTYWAAAAALSHAWSPTLSSTLGYTQADGPAGIDGIQRVRLETTYQPLGTDEFEVQKRIDFSRSEAFDSYAGRPWEISGYLRFVRNFH